MFSLCSVVAMIWCCHSPVGGHRMANTGLSSWKVCHKNGWNKTTQGDVCLCITPHLIQPSNIRAVCSNGEAKWISTLFCTSISYSEVVASVCRFLCLHGT